MNTGKKSIFKVIIGILALLILAVIFNVVNAFKGNPITAMRANKYIQQYVDKNYASMDLEIEKAIYNFKEGAYLARVQSKNSIDTKFAIYYRGGEVIRDDYESCVLGKFNTLSRLQDEYSELVIPILSKVPGLEKNTSMVQVEKWEYEKANGNIQLDMKFDKTLPIAMKITIRADLTDNSLENIAQILEDSHEILIQNNCNFTSYELFSEYKDVLVMISDVKPSDIQGGKLLNLLQKAKNTEHDSGIRVYVKGQ